MRLRLRLTDYQLATIARLLETIDGASSPADLVTLAIESELAGDRRPDCKHRRPSARRASPRRRDDLLDIALPAATGRAIALASGQTLRIEQLGDGQCVDLGAFELGAGRRHFSAARTRAVHGINPIIGAVLWSTPPEVPLLSISADSAPGHDLCFPACTALEYEQLTGIAGHANCHELHAAAQRRFGWDPAVHDPLNLWLPSEVGPDGELRSRPARCRRGDYVELVAHSDVVVVLSACPDDLFGSSQWEPQPVRLIVRGAAGAHPGSTRPRITRRLRTPASSTARNTLIVELDDSLRPRLERVRAGGWLGVSNGAVARALLFRWNEQRQTNDPGYELRRPHR